ncbi:hypothetical protein Btru_070284 [Bulinus truncatus]|nr:hypothetical protein Btru_070284 [Bulinus truncatus]
MDKKGSSLSADAAEFFPVGVSDTNLHHKHNKHLKGQERWKRGNPVEINEVPRYLTSCYPFVSSDPSKYRSEAPRFQSPFHYPGSMAPGAPMHFPPWPPVQADFLGSYLPPSYNPVTPIPVDVAKVEVPPQLNMTVGHLPGQGLLLGSHPEPCSSWMMSSLPNMYVPQQHLQPYMNQPQVYHLTKSASTKASGTVPSCSKNVTAVTTVNCGVRASMNAHVPSMSESNAATSQVITSASTSLSSEEKSVLHQKISVGLRPASPVMISRSAQTDFPPGIRDLTLREKSCLSLTRSRSKAMHCAQKSGGGGGGQDSDSGYNSPLHQPNYVSLGTQVDPSLLVGNSSHERAGSGNLYASALNPPTDATTTNRLKKKKRRQNREQRDANRMLGSGTKLLSRSSSSISSSGTKPEDDDNEKIDLNSWTDFPPVSPRMAAPPINRSPNQPVTLTIERSAHEPPWSIKFSSVDKSKSSSGDKQLLLSSDHRGRNVGPSVESPGQETDPQSSKTVQSSQRQEEADLSSHSSEGLKASKLRERKNYNKGKGKVKGPVSIAEKFGPSSMNSYVASPGPVTKSVTTTASSLSVVTTTTSMTSAVSSAATFTTNSTYTPRITSLEMYHAAVIKRAIDARSKAGLLHLASQASVLPAYSSDPSFRSYANIAQGVFIPSSTACPPSSHPPVPYQNGLYPPPLCPVVPMQTFPFYSNTGLSHPPPAVVPYEAQQAPHYPAEPAMAASYAAQLKAPVYRGRGRSRTNSLPGTCIQGSRTQHPAEEQADTAEGEEKKKKKCRSRRRREKSKHIGEADEDGDDVGLSQTVSSDTTLHFEDVDEFPDLLSSRGASEDVWAANERSTLSGASLSYSDITKMSFSKAGSQSRPQSLTGSGISEDDGGANDDGSGSRAGAESKKARKRRKRREQANKAAEAELAEISLEQQWLKEMGLKKAVSHGLTGGKSMPGIITDSMVVNEAKKMAGNKGGGKKSQQPIAVDIAAMIDAIQKKPPPQTTIVSTKSIPSPNKGSKKERGPAISQTTGMPGNMLDSSAPVQKRGKERESGKPKKPSPLKKVILKEREQRKRLRLLDDDPDTTNLDDVGAPGVGIVGGESELSQDALSCKSEGTDGGEGSGAAELSADLSPISQTSPISMSPASPGNSGVNSPVTGSIGRDPVLMKIHSRRFREYCTQILDKEIDQCCASLLQDLVKFQDRMYHKDPVKAKTKRRVVLGLREVTKHLKLKKIKCVVISPNLEKIQSKGGLDEALNNILNMCQEQSVPFVFALGRCALGRACAKLVPVSVVGIFNYEGCEQKFNSLISLTAAARAAYNDMVLAVEKEVSEYPASQTSSIAGVPGLFAAHMGHSRTPSGCSAISFTSSILSEPISENFPHAEPEVDSKGYEIVRDAAGNVVHPSNSHDIDDGNEADIEDFGEKKRKKKMGRNLNSVRFGGLGSEHEGMDRKDECSEDTVGRLSRNLSESTLTPDEVSLRGQLSKLQDVLCEGDENYNNVEKCVRDIEHIDSIHSETYSLGHELLSQHSSLPVEQRAKTPCQPANSPRPSHLSPSSLSAVCGSDIRQARQDSEDDEEKSESHHRIIDKERIENWLESQTNLITED